MKNKLIHGISLGLLAAFLFQTEGKAQVTSIKKAANRFNLTSRPAYSAYFSKLATFSQKNNSTGAQTLVAKTGALGKSEVVVNMSPAITPVRTSGNPTTQRNGAQLCETQNYIMDYLNAGIFNTFERVLPSTVFVGSFIDAQTLLNKRPSAYIANNRSPLNISISINDKQDIKSFQASAFGSNYEAELQSTLRNASFGTRIPAFLVMNISQISSTTELQANLNLSVGLMIPLEELGLPLEISQGLSGGASISSSSALNTYLITYEQPMYDYTVKENDRNLFFATGGSAAQHPNAVLVRSVIYGRRITMIVKSQEDAETVSATVKARLGVNVTGGDLGGFTAGAKVDGSVITRFNQQIKSFKATVQGGNPALANKLFSDPAAIKDYIEDPSAAVLQANTGEVPVQYVLEKVSSDVLVGVRSTGNFSVPTCIEPTYKVELVYKGIKCNKVVEGLMDDKEDIFGTCSANGERIISIPENSAISIAAGRSSEDIKTIKLEDNLALNRMAEYIVTFSPALKDWEAVHKPEFKLAQPLDGKYQINTGRLNKILALDKGASVALESTTQELKLYENADKSNASISVLYQVRVTRN